MGIVIFQFSVDNHHDYYYRTRRGRTQRYKTEEISQPNYKQAA
nr:MAG TPA: hypothetical protein [Caudoviricetes sp.]